MLVFAWAKYPFVRITVFFSIGIIIGLTRTTPVLYTAVLIGIAILSLFILRQLKPILFLNFNFLSGILISLVFIFLGNYSIWLANEKNNKENLYHYHGIGAYKASVMTEPEFLERSIKVKLNVLAVKDSSWKKASGIVLAYFEKPSTFNLTCGQSILIKGSADEVTSPKNPNEFDYKKYLSNNNIYHIDWIKS